MFLSETKAPAGCNASGGKSPGQLKMLCLRDGSPPFGGPDAQRAICRPAGTQHSPAGGEDPKVDWIYRRLLFGSKLTTP